VRDPTRPRRENTLLGPATRTFGSSMHAQSGTFVLKGGHEAGSDHHPPGSFGDRNYHAELSLQSDRRGSRVLHLKRAAFAASQSGHSPDGSVLAGPRGEGLHRPVTSQVLRLRADAAGQPIQMVAARPAAARSRSLCRHLKWPRRARNGQLAQHPGRNSNQVSRLKPAETTSPMSRVTEKQ